MVPRAGDAGTGITTEIAMRVSTRMAISVVIPVPQAGGSQEGMTWKQGMDEPPKYDQGEAPTTSRSAWTPHACVRGLEDGLREALPHGYPTGRALGRS